MGVRFLETGQVRALPIHRVLPAQQPAGAFKVLKKKALR